MMHEFVEEQVRNLLFGVGFACLALASHPGQWAGNHILTTLVGSGFVLIASASLLGISGEQPLGGGW